MKSSHGFTLLEVILTLAVIAIMVPVLAGISYQLLTTPIDTGLSLSLTNEIGLLSSQLYADGYMADRFDTCSAPYYGNFSWTDRSSNTTTIYQVSYYYNDSKVFREMTAININGATSTMLQNFPRKQVVARHIASYGNFSLEQDPNSSCIVADISTSGNSNTGKYLQKQVTIYVAQRTSVYPQGAHVYTFAIGNKWAWTMTWTDEDYAGIGLISPDALALNASAASTGMYHQMRSVDQPACYKSHADGVNMELITINVGEKFITEIRFKWVGRGGNEFKIYNAKNGSWDTFYSATGVREYGVVSHTFTSAPEHYVNSTGNLSILAAAFMDVGADSVDLCTDYIELSVSQ